MIDRLAPNLCPPGKNAGTQRWRDLLFLHWEVPAEALQRLIPAGLEVDTFEGRAFVGLVPFAMEGVRPRWIPEALSFRFLETNVRTYVIANGRPGVHFFSLDAASRLAVWTARATFGLPYFHAQMAMMKRERAIDYASRRTRGGASVRVRYEVGEPLGASAPGALEHFLLERYLLFVARAGRLFEGQVHHQPYPAQRARILEIEENLIAAAGIARPEGPPPLVHYASGVDVEVFALRPV